MDERVNVIFPLIFQLFDTRKYSNVKYLYKILDAGLIDKLEVREWIEFYPNLVPEVAQDIQQKQTLILKGKSVSQKNLGLSKHLTILDLDHCMLDILLLCNI